MLRNPTDIDIDARGRVWVCEGVNYRSSFKPWGALDPAGDRIVILEDTDHDGVADKAKTFYQGTNINSALGICVRGNRVIVSCSPKVLILTDVDGDDRADTVETLFSVEGFDHDHGVHAMVFGPDGKLYFNFGNAGKHLKDKNGKLIVDLEGNEVEAKGKPYREGMAFRCDLDGSNLEVLGHNFRNPYELAVDSFGTVWQSDNDDDGNRSVRINYVMQHGNFGYTDPLTGAGWSEAWKKTKGKGVPDDDKPLYHWHQMDPGVVPNTLVTGAGAPTGIAIYEGKLLPPVFQNQMIHCDAGTRVVRSYSVSQDGAGYAAKTTDIFSSSDTWFRPSDVCVAPDGSIFVADWNDAGVGGHNMADHEFKTMKGRIFRIAPPGNKPSVPKLDLKTASGLTQALQSPNHSIRYLAWTKIQSSLAKTSSQTSQAKGVDLLMAGPAVQPQLLALWKNGEPRMRARALQLLARDPSHGTIQIRQALRDGNPDLRIAALRIAQELKMDLTPHLKTLARDSSPQVRRECALALRHRSGPAAADLWAELATQHDGKDRWYLEALAIGADKQENEFFTAWLKKSGGQWNTSTGRDIVWRIHSTQTPAYLAQLISDSATTEKDRARYFRALDFISGKEKDDALMTILGRGAF